MPEMSRYQKMTEPYQSMLRQLKNHQIPERYPEAAGYPYVWGQGSLDEGAFFVRDEVIRLAGYCFISYRWIRPLAQWIGGRRCLEVMCGSGALSKGLQNCGVDILPTDNYRWAENQLCWYEKSWTDIEQLDAVSAIEKYGAQIDLIICSWPYTDDDCFHALMAMRRANANAMMIYIGEEQGGLTASDRFFHAAQVVQDTGFQAAIAGFRSAYQIHDVPMLIR